MIQELEAKAVSQMVNEEQGRARSRVAFDHEGVTVEVRARRRRDGAAVLGYSFDGVRLERAVLLMLICPQAACEHGQSIRRQWTARNPPTPALQRRPRTGLKSADSRVEARLFEEALIQGAGGLCVARPASFAVVTACPLGAHQPFEMRVEGWDLFRDGEYLAGGLTVDTASRASKPKFQTVNAAAAWINRVPE
jgi:hypothetical protein